ncbi:short-chain dehydrogenase/reductase-like protein SDR [Xylariaceae sp. FL0016]|nr:short-chain dehydrogenase/reductase-like protein SDR [Xylariaceae sp. FL0016]
MNPVNTQPYNLPDDATWLITGCSSGIGRELASLIAHHPSHRLIATARDPTQLSYLPSTPNILKLPLDVTSPASVHDAFAAAAAAASHFGGGALRLDVVVNNAGYELQGDTESATEAQAHDQVETVFFGSARVTMKAVEVMRRSESGSGAGRPRGGVVVQVSSLAGQCAFAGQSYYHAAKWALEGFTESVAREMRPDWNINFCLVEPAGVKTNFERSSKKFTERHPAYAAPDCPTRQIEVMVKKGNEAGHGMAPEDVARTIYHVVSRGQQIPLRVPLGPIAWGLIKKKSDGLVKDLEDIKEISLMSHSS